jgi:hypothetical protein
MDFRGHFSPIEAHSSQPGVPDYAYTIEGINGWLELKWGTPKKPPELRLMQQVWMRRNVKHGGNALIFCGIQTEDARTFGLIHANRYKQIYLTKGCGPWLKAMNVSWPGKVDWAEFLQILKQPESLR